MNLIHIMKIAAQEHPSVRKGRNAATLAGVIPGAALGGVAAHLTKMKGLGTAGMVAGGAALGAAHGRLHHNAGEARKDIAAIRALAKERASREHKAQEKRASLDTELRDDAIDTLYNL